MKTTTAFSIILSCSLFCNIMLLATTLQFKEKYELATEQFRAFRAGEYKSE